MTEQEIATEQALTTLQTAKRERLDAFRIVMKLRLDAAPAERRYKEALKSERAAEVAFITKSGAEMGNDPEILQFLRGPQPYSDT